MDNSHWYAVAIAAIAASFLCFYTLKTLIGWLKIFVVFYFFKYLRYRRIYTRLRGATTWFCALLIVVFLTGNATYLYLNINDRDELLQQTGILSTVNLIPLALGGHMNFLVNMCGLSSRDNNQMHVWIARVVVTEALLHSILAVTTHVSDFQSPATWAAVTAVFAMISILISSISLLQRHVYETFVRLHQFLAALIVAGVWVHVPRRLHTVPTVYLLVTSCVWLGLRLLRLAVILFRNIRNGRNQCRLVIWSIPDAVQVHVKVARPWKYRPGQYLYLCTRGGWMQSYPFFISWWYRDADGQDVVVFIISRRKGFSDSLARSSSGILVLGVAEGRDEIAA